MARTEDLIKKMAAEQEALEKSLREGTQPAAVSPTGATVPGAPAMGRIEAMQPRRAPIVARSDESVDRNEEKRREREARKQAERAQKDAEKAALEAAKKAAAAPPKYVLPPDMAQVVDYGKVFQYSGTPKKENAFILAAEDLGMTPERLKEVAAAQGVDLDDIYNARMKGRTYDEYVRAAKERGVSGFLTVAERERALPALAEAFDASKAGVASDKPIELKQSGAGAQVILGTEKALPEVTKPGEHAYTLASVLVDSLLKQDRPSELYDLYGRKTATGATQQYVEDRVKDLVRSTNLRADTPNFDERMQALRRRAFNEVLAYKTIGMWTPVITSLDVEAVEGRRDPTLWEAATTPNIEIVGVNNKRQAVYRMESPLGVVMRTFDLPQSALVGVISGQGAARGVQTGANFLEFALDATEGQSGFVRVPAVAAGLAASIFAPDVLSTGAAALKGVRAVSQARRVAAVAPRAVELMEQVSNARAARRFDDAAKAEVKLRNEFPAVADDLDRKDARMAESLDIIDPKADILNEDLASLLGSQIPLGSAREAAQYRPYLHPSRRRQVLQGATPTGQTASFPGYEDLFDTKKQLEAVQKAKTDYLTNGPQTVEEYAAARLRGAVRSVFASLPADVASAVDINDVEKLADDMAAQAALALSDPSKFADEAKKLIGTTIKGTDDNSKAVRKAFYARRNAIVGKVDSLRGADIKALQTADLALFERMEKAVEANNEARGAAAALLRDQLAEDARIIVQPLNIFDKVAVKTPAGEPVRLTEGGHIFLFSLRKAAPNMDFKEAYSAAAMIDAVIRAQAMKRGIDPYELYKNIFPDLRKGTAHDLERFLKQMASKGPPPASSVPPSAVPFKTSVSAEAALEAAPPIPPGYTATDIEKVDAAKRLIKEALAGDIPEVLTRIVEPGTQKTVESLSVIVGDARIVIDRTPNVEEFNVIVTLGEGADRKVTTLTKVKGNQAALTKGEKALEALMNERVKAKKPAIVGAPVKTPAAAKTAPPTAPGAAPTPTPAAPAPAAVTPAPAVVQPAPAVTPAPPAPAPAPAPAVAARPTKLPKDLAGAKSRYNIGTNVYIPKFESDIDKALFIVAQTKKSKSHDKYMDFLRDATGLSDDEIVKQGQNVRAALKARFKRAEPGEYDIEQIYQPRAVARVPAPAVVPTPAPAAVPAAVPAPAPAAKPGVLPVLSDKLAERKEQLRQYLRDNPGIPLKPLFNQFQLKAGDVKKIHAEVKAERARKAVPAPAPAAVPAPPRTVGQQAQAFMTGIASAAQIQGRIRSLEQTAAQGFVEYKNAAAADMFRQQNPTWTETKVGGATRFTPTSPNDAVDDLRAFLKANGVTDTDPEMLKVDEIAQRMGVGKAPTIAGPPTPAPITAVAEAQPEAAKIVEAPAPAKRKRATRVKAEAEAAPVAEAAPTDVLKQVSPTGEVKGAVETLADGKTILYLFEGADASTIIHEAGHILRRSILDNEDMGSITDWIKSQGVSVSHEFGEFVGDAAEIEKAEELFAKAFERYAREGIVPPSAPLLKTIFETLKQALDNVYHVASDPVVAANLKPEVRAVFDKMFEGSTTTANPTILEKVRRTLLGGTGPGFEGILTTLSREVARKGIPGFTEEDIFRMVDEAKKAGVPSNQPILKFPTKVNGKKNWSADDLAEAQTNAEVAHLDREARRIGIRLDLTARGKGTSPAMIIEDKASEALRSVFAAVEGERGVKKGVRAVGRVVVGAFLGGDMVADKGGTWLRNMPPAFRAVLDGVERVVQMAIGDTITLVNSAIDTGKDDELIKYLVGRSGITRPSGRAILSAGHNHMDAVLGMFNGMFSKLSDDEITALQAMADAVNAADPGAAMAKVGFKADGPDFKVTDAAADKTRDTIVSAYSKTMNATQKTGESEFGATLAGALRNAVQATGSPRPSHEMKLMETLLYLTKKTSRDGAFFSGSDEDAVRMILGTVKSTFDDESSRRVAVLIGSFGGADQAKRMLVNMNLGISADAERNFKQWTLAESVDEKYKPEIQRVVDRYGFNPNFVADPVLGVNFYLPAAARERLANALARANYRETATVMTSAADAFNMMYRYMKLRMTRGSFVTKGKYFMMNTTDHGAALGTIVGLGVGAASTARLLPQNLLVIPPLVGQVIDLPGRIPGSPIPRNLAERIRRGLQAAGDRGAWAVGQIFSTGKYRIQVNPILEGADGTFRAGGNVYNFRDVRNIAVEEGIFSSFDTSQLQALILKEGQLELSNTQLIRTPSLRAVPGSKTRATARLNNFFAELSDSVADLAEAWGERERLGAMVTLMEAGYSPRVAARLTIDALYDYAQTMTKNDRGFLVSVLFPFWAFQKNANMQVFNLIFSPAGAYRAMVIKRMKDRTADLASELLYDEVGSEYGVDVKSMPPELQDTYYSIMTAFYDAYDGTPPEDAKRAMRLILTGRSVGVEGGQYFETAYKLMEQRGAGAFADVNKFGQYVSLKPEKSARMSSFRDRTGISVPFPRTEAVRRVYAYLGDNHTYMEMYWPESAFEAGMKYHTQVLAAMALLGATGIEMVVPGTGMEEGGIEGVKLANVLEPVVSVERSPILGPLLPSLLPGMPQEALPPRRIAKPLSRAADAVVEIHPAIAKTLSDAYAVNFFRVPKDADPFVVSVDGKLPQLTEEDQRRIRELNDKAPGIGIAKDERSYMVGGVMSTALYNSPLGELNDLLLRWEKEPLERADIRGEILSWAKFYGGVDVSVVSASKTMKAEEPEKLKESKKF